MTNKKRFPSKNIYSFKKSQRNKISIKTFG